MKDVLDIGYHAISIKRAIAKVCDGDFLLPAIQRGVAWNHPKKISDLFDSIYKGYPVSPILLYRVVKGKNDPLTTLYRFSKGDDARVLFDNQTQDLSFLDDGDEKYVVLDGQQRLTALYRGLKKSFDGQLLHFNAAHSFAEEHNEETLEADYFDRPVFAYCQENAWDAWGQGFWIPMKALYETTDYESLIDQTLVLYEADYQQWYAEKKRKTGKAKATLDSVLNWKARMEEHKSELVENLERARRIFLSCEDPRGQLEYHLVDFSDRDLEEQRMLLLSIFVRFNMGGEALAPADLLYAQLAAATKMEDVKAVFRENMKEINLVGQQSYFKLPHFMRLLWLVFGSGSFKSFFASQEVQKCTEKDIEEVKQALIRAKHVYLAAHFDFSHNASYNMFLPIAYYFYQIRHRAFSDEQIATIQLEIAKYYSAVNLTGYFSGQSDSTLSRVKKGMAFADGCFETFEQDVFSFKRLQEAVDAKASFRAKKLAVSEEAIDQLLDLEYGVDNATITRLFAFLKKDRTNLFTAFPKQEDLDHMHPKKYANQPELLEKDGISLPDGVWEFYVKTHNRVANLQLLESAKNRGEKRDKSLQNWATKRYKGDALLAYLKHQFVLRDDEPFEESLLAFENYKDFYEQRRQHLKDTLCRIFAVDGR